MQYIVFDLEFNQASSSEIVPSDKKAKSQCPFEIIQIGAIKLASDFRATATFNRFIKPAVYKKVSPFITDLTGITTEQLVKEGLFPEVFYAFLDFIGEPSEAVFCVWGRTDMKELYRNAKYYDLDQNLLPKMYINVQPYVSTYLGFSKNNLLRLQNSVEALGIGITFPFHNALYDAYYTAQILKKLNPISIQAMLYDPSYVGIKHRQPKRVIDFDKLIGQFEKMYARNMTEEEKQIIKLAYQMGKTQQFIRTETPKS
ncbi:exonuclease domain-containing protein [Mobilitalea sibirica]|uniref:Exonuclease domain-containing protein n=1 Tax=Mobilitalea sibirica TaxID=1462919 RepID=A0A8J7H289_9FIRM|nr:3'-5' exonuclease [Mobilitalea sibirica]MBH1940813.1 exonuclease domain-containing protein [Mobilitalea sibirica]